MTAEQVRAKVSTHTTVPLANLQGLYVDIDEKIAPLIIHLWDREWDTISSCQGPQVSFAHGNIFAHVAFVYVEHAAAFAELCGRRYTRQHVDHVAGMFGLDNGDPYDAMFSAYEVTTGRRKKTLWEVKVQTVRWPNAGATVFFEHTDLPYITKALQRSRTKVA